MAADEKTQQEQQRDLAEKTAQAMREQEARQDRERRARQANDGT